MIKETNIINFSTHKFHGGIHPEQNKSQSSEADSKIFPLANELLLPYSATHENFIQNVQNKPLKKGDEVRFGQPLFCLIQDAPAAVVHSPCDAKVLAIEESNLGHPSGFKSLSIRLKTDSFYARNSARAAALKPISQWQSESTQVLFNRIKDAGIVGLGGAVFPTHLKLISHSQSRQTLIINAMECEPYITCDDRLMRERAEEILQGALIAAKIIHATEILVGIEDNKEQAILALGLSIPRLKTQLPVKIIVSPTKYPSGGEKQLIQILTGKEVPENQYPAALGIRVLNAATLFAIKQAVVDGFPLTRRLVTITGDAVNNAGNYWIDFGTSISSIAEQLAINLSKVSEIIFGGPLMGQKINNPHIPTSKATNCIIFNEEKLNESRSKGTLASTDNSHSACIRCGQCEQVCPMSLLPQQLYWFSKSEQWKEVEEHSLFDCIECGACSYVCPSEIPLVGYYRYAKSQVKMNASKLADSDKAKQRFDNREARLSRIKAEREEKRRQTTKARKQSAKNKMDDPEGKKTAIQDALARINKKKNNE